MEMFELNATDSTPYIMGNSSEGRIEMKGMCRPENSVAFFHPFISWLKYFEMTVNKQVDVILELNYVNTSSGMIIYRILKGFKQLAARRIVQVTWLYEEDDTETRQVGEDFRYMLGDMLVLVAKVK